MVGIREYKNIDRSGISVPATFLAINMFEEVDTAKEQMSLGLSSS
jgi:hypothetical protein